MPVNGCDNFRAQIAFFLDGELDDREREDVEAHLSSCHACRAFFENEESFLLSVRQARHLDETPSELRARLAGILAEETRLSNSLRSPTATNRLRKRIARKIAGTIDGPFAGSSLSRFGKRWIAVGLVLAALASFIYIAFNRNRPTLRSEQSDFARLAVDSHERRLRGQLPLEITSDSPQEISEWFAGKVSFSFKLPNYQESSGQERLYELEGARLVALENDYAACVAYRMRQRPITLVVTSNESAMPSGGEQISFKGLNFHYHSIAGLNVITWSDRGLTYALVSDFDERGQQSCIVCHTGSRDRDIIEGLKPRV